MDIASFICIIEKYLINDKLAQCYLNKSFYEHKNHKKKGFLTQMAIGKKIAPNQVNSSKP